MSGLKAWREACSDFITGRAAQEKQRLFNQQERERQWLKLANQHLEKFLVGRFPVELCFSEIIRESGDRYIVRVTYEKCTVKRHLMQWVYRPTIADPGLRDKWLAGIVGAMKCDLGINYKDERGGDE